MKFLVKASLLVLSIMLLVHNVDAQSIINDKNGLFYVQNGRKIQIDLTPRTMSRYSINVVDINNDGITEYFIYYYVDYVVKQISLVIIANGKIVFDSKDKIYHDVYCNDKSQTLDFNEGVYGHRTKIENGKIFLDINKAGKYSNFSRLIYNAKTYQLITKQELNEKNQANKLATIKDPDGYTNLRQGPSKNTIIIKKIKEGETFNIIEYGEWCEILTNDGTRGYIHKSRIRIKH